ncbi:WYL domain-containing protein [Gorillibacterium sp. CAU 1737]|uniref:helix-turn-helix transcriptional regulator n=1 Tax=Gorillibacterium sp. CAU 1737 TaxID=3140362 RepID=UPI003260C61B
MKRQDRMIALLLALQQRNETAGSLAAKFEVSPRTIIRDIQALAEMGVPLYSESGPSGGYRLMSGYRLPPLTLDSGEALALLLALKALQGYSDTPFNQERWTVLDKLTAILPQELLDQVEPLLSRVDLDVPKRSYRIPLFPELIRHAAEGRWLRVDYRSKSGPKPVTLRPDRIYAANGFWYCEAYSWTHRERRLFRIDRMDRLDVISEPEGAREAEQAGSTSSDKETGVLHIRARLGYRGMLQIERDPHIGECLTYLGEDQWEADFQLPAAERSWAVTLFHSLGLDAEVLDPPSLRQEIGQLALQVAERYS